MKKKKERINRDKRKIRWEKKRKDVRKLDSELRETCIKKDPQKTIEYKSIKKAKDLRALFYFLFSVGGGEHYQ